MIQSIIGTAVSGDYNPPPPPWPPATDPGGAVESPTGNVQLGLWKCSYTGYMNDDIAGLLAREASSDFYNHTADTSFQINNPGGQDYSVIWTGYLQAPATDAFKFQTSSDDASYFWIGTDAVINPTVSNVDINNGGLHGLVSVESEPISLIGGMYYPIRAIFSQQDGADNFYMYYDQGNTGWNSFPMAYTRYSNNDAIGRNGF
jgi:hypothetical protein